jgi:hypothetical protein
LWCDGEWRDGEWGRGEWRGGVWHDGLWHDGVWHGGEWRGGFVYGRENVRVVMRSVFTGLYRYPVWSVLFDDGERWVRMGCLFKSLDNWEEVGIRKSNLSEFPNDGSYKCEERVAAFEFAKAAVLRMKAPDGK